MVTVSDVRTFLKDLPEEIVSDATIQEQINVATHLVENEKSAYASDQAVEYAILLSAAHLTAIAYASELERSLGVIPPQLNTLVNALEEMKEKALEIVRRGLPADPRLVATTSDSAFEAVRQLWSTG